jgi:hypothetical protein
MWLNAMLSSVNYRVYQLGTADDEFYIKLDVTFDGNIRNELSFLLGGVKFTLDWNDVEIPALGRKPSETIEPSEIDADFFQCLKDWNNAYELNNNKTFFAFKHIFGHRIILSWNNRYHFSFCGPEKTTAESILYRAICNHGVFVPKENKRTPHPRHTPSDTSTGGNTPNQPNTSTGSAGFRAVLNDLNHKCNLVLRNT